MANSTKTPPPTSFLLLFLFTLLLPFIFSRVSANLEVSYSYDKFPEWSTGTYAELSKRINREEFCLLGYMAKYSNTLSQKEKNSLYKDIAGLNCSQEAPTSISVAGINSAQRYALKPIIPSVNSSEKSCGISYPDLVPYFLKTWKFSKSPLYGDTPSHSLFKYCEKNHINKIHFIGESVSDQISSYLLREYSKYQWKHQSNPQFQLSFPPLSYLPCGLKRVGMAAKKPTVCATSIPALCIRLKLEIPFVRNLTLKVVQEDIEKYPNNHRVIIFHPFGAHIWKEDIHRGHDVAMAIIETEKALRSYNTTLLILESPAQQFVYNYDWNLKPIDDFQNSSGVYSPGRPLFRPVGIPCCEKIQKSDSGNFRNLVLLKELTAIDPTWRERIGWLPLYEITALEMSKVDLTSDCTHIAYQPFLLDPVWWAIEEEVTRLWKNKEKLRY